MTVGHKGSVCHCSKMAVVGALMSFLMQGKLESHPLRPRWRKRAQRDCPPSPSRRKRSGAALQGSIWKFFNKVSNSRSLEKYFPFQLQIISPEYLLDKVERHNKSATSNICPVIGEADFVRLGAPLSTLSVAT